MAEIAMKVPVSLSPGLNTMITRITGAVKAAWGKKDISDFDMLFVHKGRLVKLQITFDGEIEILPLKGDGLTLLLQKHLEFFTYPKGKPVLVDPPPRLIKALQDQGDWDLPEIISLQTHPFLNKDGEIVWKQGYMADSGTMCIHDLSYQTITDEPTLEDAKKAIQFLKTPFEEFKFTTEACRSLVISAILSGFAREMLPTCPFYLITASTKGAGKSLLANLIASSITGTQPMLIVDPKNEEEQQKVLGSILQSGVHHGALIFDNLTRKFGSGTLAAYFTTGSYSCRTLGKTEMKTYGAREMPIIIGTGVNSVVKDDMGRRTVCIDIEVDCERPDKKSFHRTEWDIKEWVLQNRAEITSSALTILRAYIHAGQPPHPGAYGGFEAWNRLVRGSLVWAGEPDPLGDDIMELVEELDQDHEKLFNLASAWWEVFKDEEVTVVDLVKAADNTTDARRSLLEALVPFDYTYQGKGELNYVKISSKLRGIKNQICGEKKLLYRRSHGKNLWHWQSIDIEQKPICMSEDKPQDNIPWL